MSVFNRLFVPPVALRPLILRAIRPFRLLILHRLPLAMQIRRQWRQRFGTPLDLRNPRTFNQKIQWLKVHSNTPLHTRCGDKIAVRDYVAEVVGPDILIPLIMTTGDPDDIRPERICAERFVVKTNHDSGSVVICRDRRDFDWAECREKLRKHMQRNFYEYTLEPSYKNIVPRILVEEFKEDDGEDLADLKILCFHGSPEIITLNITEDGQKWNLTYDKRLERVNVRRVYPTYPRARRPPGDIQAMLAAAAKLAAPFPLCRVDLYPAEGRIWFGELTFFPNSGLVSFDPPEIDLAWGDLIDLKRARRQLDRLRRDGKDRRKRRERS